MTTANGGRIVVWSDVNGTRLWFDIDGVGSRSPGRPDASATDDRLGDGGPASYDHSYFKPYFSHLANEMQVVDLDLRNHGRSARADIELDPQNHAPTIWRRSVTPSASKHRWSSGTRWEASSPCSTGHATLVMHGP